jgi:EamA domain-containing membrane protein RarD
MALMSMLKTTTSGESPLDGSTGSGTKPPVSDFLTLQSLTNFAVMAAAIGIAWRSLGALNPRWSSLWVPYAFAAFYGVISILTSIDGLRKDGKTLELGTLLGAVFIALINSLVLASAVVGSNGTLAGQGQ